MSIQSTKMNEVMCGYSSAIYCDQSYKKGWTAGRNQFGQCGASTFHEQVTDI